MLLTILFSLAILTFSFILTIINWKILQISVSILDVSKALLKETIIIRVETIKIREVSVAVYKETKLLRQNIGEPIPTKKKSSIIKTPSIPYRKKRTNAKKGYIKTKGGFIDTLKRVE